MKRLELVTKLESGQVRLLIHSTNVYSVLLGAKHSARCGGCTSLINIPVLVRSLVFCLEPEPLPGTFQWAGPNRFQSISHVLYHVIPTGPCEVGAFLPFFNDGNKAQRDQSTSSSGVKQQVHSRVPTKIWVSCISRGPFHIPSLLISLILQILFLKSSKETLFPSHPLLSFVGRAPTLLQDCTPRCPPPLLALTASGEEPCQGGEAQPGKGLNFQCL